MANTFGALKRVRVTERRTALRNRVAKDALAAPDSQHASRTGCPSEPGNLNEIMAATFSLVDKAARKGYIKSGTASRYKSRLHTRVKVALAPARFRSRTLRRRSISFPKNVTVR